MPVYDARVKAQLQKLLEIQWADNSKARFINEAQDNPYVPRDDSQRVRAQVAFRDYVASLAGELL